MRRLPLYIILLFQFSACSQQNKISLKNVALVSGDAVICQDSQLRTKIFDSFKDYILNEKEVLTAKSLNSEIDDYFLQLQKNNPSVLQDELLGVKKQLQDLFIMLLSEAPDGERVENSQQLLMLLSALDVGDQSTPFRSYLQKKLRQSFIELKLSSRHLDVECPRKDAATSPTVHVNPDFEYHKQILLSKGENLAVLGERWAFATAYQSCQSVQLPSLDDKIPDVQGISIVGKHPDGIGNRRLVTNLELLQKTDYYIGSQEAKNPTCFDVYTNPLIYDYGGKPYATSAKDSSIDLFRDNGDGTRALGVDCSGFVYTALATSGLRFQEGRSLRASDSWAWGSGSYLDPQGNGLTCFDKITLTPLESLKAGDVVAVQGHVIIIDKIGDDPFGVKAVSTEAECSNIKSDGFNFVVVQSSPSKGGIGINYYEAKHYLPTNTKMKAGLERYAYYACLAKFANKSFKPQVGTLSVIRHKGTPECLAPRVVLERESCIQTCSSFIR